jgi:CheY-like chemotaxis protein
VLIGEDDAQAVERIAATLWEGGFTIESVRNGAELLEKALLERPDAILIKDRLGNMQGDAVAGMLRKMPGTRDIPVVLYDGAEAGVPPARHEDAAPGMPKLVRSANGPGLLHAVRAALGG